MVERLKQIKEPLLKWYCANARDLPWRNIDDPYRIWVSEIMLQQTRVAAVLGYYDRFLKSFPTVQDLANASEEQLLKLWEGLGYYSRARNMQKAAKTIVNELNGEFPSDYDGLRGLSGIGDYTAGAIASAAFGERVPAVDGNVLRVISRITENGDNIADSKTKARYKQLLEDALPHSMEDMRIFNQAMMELGAVVCIPNGQPKCTECPINHLCMAGQKGTAMQYPVKSPKKARRIEEKTVLILMRDDCVALQKRGSGGLLAGLWQFPNEDYIMDENQVYSYLSEKHLRVIEWEKQLHAKHIFTHIEWHMTGYVLRVLGEGDSDYVWVNREDFDRYAIPSAFSKFTKEVTGLLQA